MNRRLKILLVGCGDIATRLASQLPVASCDITGLRRRAVGAEGVRMVAGDVVDTAAIAALLQQGFDYIVVTLTPGQRGEQGYRDSYYRGMNSLLAAIAISGKTPRCLLFVSSTSVYGQRVGEWVDEASVTEPDGFSGGVLLETEQLLQRSDVPNCIVRFSGIYGPGRNHLIEQVRNGAVVSKPFGWTNRIHSNDCAGVLKHLIEKHNYGQALEPVYIGSDCEPVMQWQVRSWLAEKLGVAVEPVAEADVFEESGKRCSNRLLCESGYRFFFPDFRSGYTQLLSSTQTDSGG